MNRLCTSEKRTETAGVTAPPRVRLKHFLAITERLLAPVTSMK